VFKPTAALMTIATPNLERLVDFYQHLFNQPPVSQIPNSYAEFRLPGLTLGIFRPQVDQQISPSPLPEIGSQTLAAVSLCLEVENLETAIAQFRSLGYPPPGTILYASHGREIYAYDPDGNGIILHQRLS
jgi:catechol 2,3-dioxygenase-like lactoylglutathione lyase family enzyme